MNDLVFAGNKALYLVLLMSAWPIVVATVIGLLVGLFQTVTQLQEQTLPFGIKLFGVSLCLFLLSGWYGETLLAFGREVMRLALAKG
ncbi:EscS/YscS/HrcS family type III secretion system export apparatus protein [Chromobacterium subtsugae]|uniref:EscS/YscS/HrcS family type III secretion system export apparatus protein n=1 Tax=Chromobacterium subtsugae TaxID=251747 RepID=A0ABS7FEQ5_9NEIS|nr:MULTISPECIES: EscS/YscS/HrcS family type III secretion system export apparatus protein [Chromobacterium]KUM05626.1 type III secretion system protein SpaQ [Chromobacterium subtsugae]KZE88096.1 type III secretion system protein SpaQ [Chromobacterium sp. F49]MBW7565735.1 EscS/YscS/HrcS family type III secretion system export apparatus protein [Chromobacterium subtsugae]MBW8288560.1 EscS/YscS/HrcS family type III secretion system export apparatus protein [Chromobacterium subtsugae]WSE89831.1 Es